MMRIRLLVVLVLILFVNFTRPAQAQATALTIGTVFQQIKSLIRQTEDSASHLIQQGNTAAAQQQMLLNGLLRSILQQAETSYGRSLDRTTESLIAVERDAFLQLHEALDQIERLESNTNADLAERIRQTQAAANHVLSQLPLTKRHPAIFGARTRDLLREFDRSPADIEILGFWLTDPDLRIEPVVSIDGILLPRSAVTTYFDRVEISLPDARRQKLSIDNPPCAPRQPFRVALTVTYPERRGFWPFYRTIKQEWVQTLNVLPGEIQYQVTVAVSGERTSERESVHPYTAESPSFEWSCEQNASNVAAYTLPDAAHFNNDGTADFSLLTGRYENNGCTFAFSGRTATANCWVRGGNRDCALICNCPGGGNGIVRVRGTYTIRHNETSAFAEDVVAHTTMRTNGTAYITLPSDSNTRIQTVRVDIRRANSREVCPTLYDTMLLHLPTTQPGASALNSAKATSDSGQFEAVASRTHASIRKLDR